MSTKRSLPEKIESTTFVHFYDEDGDAIFSEPKETTWKGGLPEKGDKVFWDDQDWSAHFVVKEIMWYAGKASVTHADYSAGLAVNLKKLNQSDEQ